MFSKTFRILTILAIFAVAFAFTPSASAGSEACDTRVNNTHKKLQECVTLEGARAHQAALQAIADANNGTRVSGSPGFDQSVAYAQQVFTNAGYNVTVQPFQFQTFVSLSPSILEQISPSPAVFSNSIMSYSGSGDVTAAVTALPAPPADPTPGCEAADFAGFPAGNIALISRGACTFAIKATNAAAAPVLAPNRPVGNRVISARPCCQSSASPSRPASSSMSNTLRRSRASSSVSRSNSSVPRPCACSARATD